MTGLNLIYRFGTAAKRFVRPYFQIQRKLTMKVLQAGRGDRTPRGLGDQRQRSKELTLGRAIKDLTVADSGFCRSPESTFYISVRNCPESFLVSSHISSVSEGT